MRFTFVFDTRRVLNLEAYDIMHDLSEMSFGMMLHHLSCVLEDVFFFGSSFDHGCDLEL